MARTGFYPRPYPVCDGSGGRPIRVADGVDWTACGGCTACQPPADPAREQANADRGGRAAELVLAAGAALDDEPF